MQPLVKGCLKGSVALIALRPALGQPDTPKDTNQQNKNPNNHFKKKIKREGQVSSGSAHWNQLIERGQSVGKEGVQQVWFARRALGENLPMQRLEGLPH